MENSKHALIIGASRGIGLGLATTLAERGWLVTATTRNAIPESHPAIDWLTLDINDAGQRSALQEPLSTSQFEVIFINAGVFGPEHQDVMQASDDELLALFTTNAFSPVRCAAELLPLLTPETGILALMSSQLASLNENNDATYPLYAASKAALNMLSRELAQTTARHSQTLLCVHPGWVQTDMGGSEATLTVAQSASGIADQLDKWRGKGGHHYVDYAGNVLTW
ncbi:SDR family oxidoreductase [Erwiniaceae bacterium BAC15a-03b]|uniref:SDR family oxidoreductase n=1 Tax=Winslowiella arboricola TaxID=2978220 RepID=A0A9J6PI90_9GAMM|nr:SDR family oxidoreductase [Winslowiella arboricola]MCU5771132.1 SDR family oxidoreductase [Winslowiella arboricola]MCU5776422.1 SDR family oxidoreductase [Winslowiella arboricola]